MTILDSVRGISPLMLVAGEAMWENTIIDLLPRLLTACMTRGMMKTSPKKSQNVI